MHWFSEFGTYRVDLQGPTPPGSALLLLAPYTVGIVAALTLLPRWTSAAVALGLAAMALRAVHLYLRPRAPRRVTALALGPDGGLQVRFSDRSWRPARVRCDATLPGACLLALDSERGALFVPVRRRAVADRSWRRLRCWLQHGQGAVTAPPAGSAGERIRGLVRRRRP